MSGTSMQALIKETDEPGYKLTEIEVPVPAAHQTLIKVAKVGICGSDIPLYLWNDVGKSIATLPFIPGHEAIGEIVSIGDGEQPEHSLVVGDRVGVENHYYCESCFQCKQAVPHICSKMGQLGHGKFGNGPGMDAQIAKAGGCAKYAVVPTKMLYKLNPKVTDTQACLLEPMGVAHHATEAAGVKPDSSVLILGAGAIGLLATQICKASNCKVLAVDTNDERLGLAKEFGAYDTLTLDVKASGEDNVANVWNFVSSHTEGFGVEYVLEVTGVPYLVNATPKFAAKGGAVCFIGIPKSPIEFSGISGKDLVFGSKKLVGIHGRKIFHTWKSCEDLIISGKVQPEKVVTHDVPLVDFQQAFDTLLAGKGIKILMTP